MISAEQFHKCFPAAQEPTEWAAALNAVLPTYHIDSKLRIAAFLAQCGHESIGFTKLVENLNYSAEALTRTWPKRFPADVAAKYARQPERIGNRAYANRMGNGPEESGDGYRHRGRGLIQLTGKGNQSDFARSINKTLDETLDYLKTKQGAVESACWYWKTRELNALADVVDMKTLTVRINGGLMGLDDRKARYNRITEILSCQGTATS